MYLHLGALHFAARVFGRLGVWMFGRQRNNFNGLRVHVTTSVHCLNPETITRLIRNRVQSALSGLVSTRR